MSTSATVLSRPATPVRPAPRRISVAAVRAALEDVVAENPDGADPRVVDDLPPRYVHKGDPACLVAKVLSKLGFSTGVLQALDQEHPAGVILECERGVRVSESRHPALCKLADDARLLLAYVQDRQDRGEPWRRIVAGAFQPATWVTQRRDRQRKPWLYGKEQAS